MRFHRFGAYALLLAAPVFLVGNVITGLRWRDPPYSWATNNISDLGNVTCGRWDTTRPRTVCSPWHVLMNSAAITTGVLLALGILLTWTALGRGIAARSAQVLALASAAGYVLAGAYPADVNENNHFLAALLLFGTGNAAMLAAAVSSGPVLARMRLVSLALGLSGGVGAVLFGAQADMPGLGVGGLERVAVFPLLIWAVVIAGRLLSDLRRPGGGRVPQVT